MKEVVWLWGLVGMLEILLDKKLVYCDSQSAMHSTRNQMDQTDWCSVALHRDIETRCSNTRFYYSSHTANNPTDILTKPIPTVKFRHFLNLISVSSIWNFKEESSRLKTMTTFWPSCVWPKYWALCLALRKSQVFCGFNGLVMLVTKDHTKGHFPWPINLHNSCPFTRK